MPPINNNNMMMNAFMPTVHRENIDQMERG